MSIRIKLIYVLQSLVEEAKPGTFVLLDSFIDRTQGRKMSFYGQDGLPGVCHIPMEAATCVRTRAIIEEECRAQGLQVMGEGTVVTIQVNIGSYSYCNNMYYH